MRYVIYCKLKTRSYLLATESTEKNLNIKNEGFDLIREFCVFPWQNLFDINHKNLSGQLYK